jgi:hypothetical protein
MNGQLGGVTGSIVSVLYTKSECIGSNTPVFAAQTDADSLDQALNLVMQPRLLTATRNPSPLWHKLKTGQGPFGTAMRR